MCTYVSEQEQHIRGTCLRCEVCVCVCVCVIRSLGGLQEGSVCENRTMDYHVEKEETNSNRALHNRCGVSLLLVQPLNIDEVQTVRPKTKDPTRLTAYHRKAESESQFVKKMPLLIPARRVAEDRPRLHGPWVRRVQRQHRATQGVI